MTKSTSNISWADSIIDLLYSKGVKYACISPGSRNTPLTNAFINHKQIKCFSHIDERTSCYFAIGLSKTKNASIAILTTSGTAIANLFPGIIESSLSLIPLIILTADRPKRLLNTGATQTINQNKLYGKYVRAMIDIEHKKTNPKTLLKNINNTIDIALGKNLSPLDLCI